MTTDQTQGPSQVVTEESIDKPWVPIHQLIEADDAAGVIALFDALEPSERALAISRLSEPERGRLMEMIGVERAAKVVESLAMAQAVDVIESLDAPAAAEIVDQLRSDQQADLINELDAEQSEAILDALDPEDAAEARRLAEYPADTAGGLMSIEYLAFPRHLTVADVLDLLRQSADVYADFAVQYAYVVDRFGKLIGVLTMRDMLFSRPHQPVDVLMITRPRSIRVDHDLDHLLEFFDRHRFLGAPVVDDEGHLLGVLSREAVEAADRDRSDSILLKISGIIGGEEYRSMPLLSRSGRRLSWLSINIVLNIIAASVIAVYQDTLAAAITLAVFLPMISDMSGCSGSQAVAVSMREMTLGLIRPTEIARVLGKEILVGVINGVTLGVLLGCIALLWKGNPYLGLVVGGALAVNTTVAVCWGGMLPLILRRLKLDPALVSGPLLTTVTDMSGFFLVFSFATIVLDKIAT